jgi:hypothetical protein
MYEGRLLVKVSFRVLSTTPRHFQQAGSVSFATYLSCGRIMARPPKLQVKEGSTVKETQVSP